jgi:HK97 family phage prohead protease
MKYTTGYITKAATESDNDGTFVLNEGTADRMGDIIEAKGWMLDDFIKNPIALWMHDHEKPIGVWENVHVKGKQLIGSLRLGSTNLAKMAKQLLDDGILKAVSVGFRPIDYDPIDKDDPWGAWHIKSALLLETSLVSVPAHPNALRISKSLGLSREERELVFGASTFASQIDPEVREKAINPAVLRATKSLEAARNTLRIKS